MSRFAVLSSSFSRSSRHAGLLCALACFSVVGSAALTGCSSGSSTTSTTTGTTGTSGSAVTAGRGTLNLTFSNPTGTNASTTTLQSSQATGALGTNALGLSNLAVGGNAVEGSAIRAILLNVLTNGPAVVGTSYPFGGDSASTLSYTQSSTSGGTPSIWAATSGSVVVDSVTGKTYKLHVVNATMATGEGNDSAATGSFTLNGTAEVTVP